MYFVRTPYIIKKLFPNIIWDLPEHEYKIYLTFDDGPHPEITPWILEQLKKNDAKATFFCLGKNAEKYPEMVQQIVKEGHKIGNHGYEHLNGWKISEIKYEKNILKGKDVLKNIIGKEIILFRPPYGNFKKSKTSSFKSQIIMWSLMPGDFDQKISSEKCYQNLQKAKSGDIIVLHDNVKSWKHLEYCLPKFLDFCKEKKFSLNKINL